jgi:hypothetical protein
VKEEDMEFYPFPAWRAKLFAVVLFVAFAVSGCKKEAPHTAFTCVDITITVDPSKPKGVDHKATYLCKNHTVTWVPGPHVASFEVKFVGHDTDDFPFGPHNTTFGPNQATPPLPDPVELSVFKYNLKIVDDIGTTHQFDPHVVGGGGLID